MSSTFSILYGIEKAYVDVTRKAILYHYLFNKNNKFRLPSSDDDRCNIFGDHLYGVVKHLIVVGSNGSKRYDDGKLLDNIDIPYETIKSCVDSFDASQKIDMIHRNSRFSGGDINDELPEQVMTATFIKDNSCVLELGSNIGRNTIVIGCLLKDSSNLVTLETNPDTCKALNFNRNSNNLKFHIVNAALSSRNMIQHKDEWDVKMSDEVLENHFKINLVTFDELEAKYNKRFDTLVADCEGSLYYIFQDFPDMLSTIDTVIMENDYKDIEHKQTVDEFLVKNGFKCVYRQPGGWDPCYRCFYETWKK